MIDKWRACCPFVIVVEIAKTRQAGLIKNWFCVGGYKISPARLVGERDFSTSNEKEEMKNY